MPIVMDLGFVELGELMISLAKQTEQGETMLPRFGPHRGNLLMPICSLIMREITKLIEMSGCDLAERLEASVLRVVPPSAPPSPYKGGWVSESISVQMVYIVCLMSAKSWALSCRLLQGSGPSITSVPQGLHGLCPGSIPGTRIPSTRLRITLSVAPEALAES